MAYLNTTMIARLLEDAKSSKKRIARKAYKEIMQISHLETKVDLITNMARNCCFEKLAQKAFADLKKEMSTSGEYSAEQEAGQMEEMVYYGCRMPSIRVLAIEHILGLLEDGKIPIDADGSAKFLNFVLEKTKNKESATVLRAQRILHR